MLPDWRIYVTNLVEHGVITGLATLAATLGLLILLQWVIS
jgi:hypothetical protein